jgi:hypothetical protein
MTGQVSSYLGPGILTRGAGDIGTRAGQDVNLRFFVNASGIYDNGIQPYSVDGKGQLVTVNGLWGTEVAWEHTESITSASRGWDWTTREATGTTPRTPFTMAPDHSLALGYTYQKSRRLIFGPAPNSRLCFAGHKLRRRSSHRTG